MALTAKEKAAALNASMARVATGALNAGTSRWELVATVADVCGKAPAMALYQATKLSLTVGFMASALRRKGDNRPDNELLADCRDKIVNYQGAGGTGKLRKGQKGRRSQTEEDAYASARNLNSRIFNDAGVKIPETRGGANGGKATAANNKAKAKAAAKAPAKETSLAPRKFAKPEAFVEYVLIQCKAIQGSLNKSAACVPERAGTAINHFMSEMLAVADELGMRV